MAQNIAPIFTGVPSVSSVLITAANTSSQGGGTIGTDIFLAFQADVTDGSLVSRLRFVPTATTPTNTTATVLRVFISTQSTGATTSANTWLWAELTAPVIAADNASNAVPVFEIPMNIALEPGQTILVSSHAAPAANTAWRAIVVGGDY